MSSMQCIIMVTKWTRIDRRIIPTTCYYWLNGRCNRNPCRFLHSKPPIVTKTVNCNGGRKRCSESESEENSLTKRAATVWIRNSGDCISKTPLVEPSQTSSPTISTRVVGEVSQTSSHTSSTEVVEEVSQSSSHSLSTEVVEEVSQSSSHSLSTEVVETADSSSPILSTAVVEVSQSSSAILSTELCKYWINGNCVHGDKCRDMHSWFSGDRLSAVTNLEGHKKLVTGITLPVGTNKLFSGSTDGTVRIWDCHTAECANVTNLGDEVNSLISEGPWIFVGLSNIVKAWNIQNGSGYTLEVPNGRVLAMTIGKDTLLAGAEDGVISAWKGSSEANSPFKLVASLLGHSKSVVCLTVGCPNKRLFSGSMDHSIKVWDLDTFECKMTLNGHTDTVTSLICWGNFLLSSSLDCTIKVWAESQEKTLQVAYSHNVENGIVALNAMTDAEDKTILFCSCRDNSVRLYELPSFSERGRLFARQEVRSIEKGPGGLIFTGDGTGLVTVSKWSEEAKVEAA
ncbi:zinc finger CCCH domain-containing protein 48-like isoform X1 [Trifolium pratense]|uniref:zinc finger CCCH domain-containing protein 48-like isoform X1 n=2 Tax=Trifolium pratense TaxID=57577 RepID=UPI001E6947BE|nr:zinc finger CCCH domain-containing protein 48-like isoform X1 [Trifolium pratense]